MAKAMQERNQADTSAFMQAMQGAPAREQAPVTPVDDNGVANIPAQFDAVAPDRNKALAIASGSSSPALQGYGRAMIEQLLKTPDNPFSKVDPKDFTGESLKAFAASGGKDYTSLVPVRKMENISGVAVDMYGQKAGAVLPQDPNALFTRGADGQATLNQPVFQAKQNLARSGASNVTVNTEKGYAGEIAKGLAGQDLASIDAARSAGDRIQNAQGIKKLLDQNPITGTGAEARLSVTKALSTAGLIDGKQVKSTEDLGSLLASSTLDAIKTSGLGSGQGFTDKDRAFLERAKSGNLEINAGTLRTLADLNEKAARASITRGREVAKRLQGNPIMGTVGQDFQFNEPPPLPTTPIVRTSQSRGGRSTDDLLKMYGD
jgi:hypothetical protein